MMPGWAFRISTMITLTAGTAFIMWLGEQITEKGIGNGVSIVIFAGIIARMPGVKTKIIVASDDSDVDPAGCLIGPKGMRVRNIVDELFGEKIDILNYTTNQEEMVRRALVPGVVEQIEIDEENNIIRASVKDEEKAKVLGRGGTNINIA